LEIRADGTTGVGIRSVSPSGRHLLYAVRDGGRDEVELRVRDLETGEDLEDRLPNALYGSSWIWSRDGDAFLYVHRSREDGPRARIHRLGTPVADDEEVLGAGVPPTAFLSVSRVDEDSRLLVEVQHGWARQDVYLADAGEDGLTPTSPPVPLVEGVDAQFDVRFHDGRLWIRTSHQAPNYRLITADPEEPGIDSWEPVIPESDETLQDFALIDGRLYVTYLDDVASRIRVFETDGTPAGEVEIPELSRARIAAADDGTAHLTVESFTQPEIVWEIDLETGERAVHEEPDVEFDADGIEVSRLWAESGDGTRVPYFVIHRAGLEPDGDEPTLLYGYGGFNVALEPGFSPRAATWVEAGGVYAQASLRGGGEFGDDWHRDGWLGAKQHVFDDFIAVAEDLMARDYTDPERLAIRGVSNGGLLMGSVVTQRPDLFRVAFIGFPDLDMIRFDTFERTNNKPALLEYGDASDPEQFQFLRSYSPYQAVDDGTEYPAVLIASGDLDTRVPPLQARKMAARLQAASASPYPVILRYDPRAGHAGGRTMQTRIDDTAAELAFAWWQLGSPRWWEGEEP
ncbi:MAG: prolyl oligopeptidase family serine peptidase, partial [Acidobacteriota bacterium]